MTSLRHSKGVGTLCFGKLRGPSGSGETSFKLVSEGKNSVDANNFIVGTKVLQGDLTVMNPLLGVDVSQRNPNARPHAWGLVSDDINFQARNIQATSVAANKLTVANVTVTVERGKENVCGVG
ncbi:DUF6230 family protein [Corynebacterium poyangense]|uniref:DUF6230 family protein n=1 Tax=Corynebacterium poyangense TaxID=2684405 RepID=UPI001CAA88AC|nr:DUF6230 family protein [Corynebacterium poyangense]